jgi:hypothetical protein
MITCKLGGHLPKYIMTLYNQKRNKLTGPLLVQLILFTKTSLSQACKDMVAEPAAVMIKILIYSVPIH